MNNFLVAPDLKLDHLCDNLSYITAAIASNSQESLVPSFSGTHLYTSSTIWGRWRIFIYSVHEWFSGHRSLREENLQKVMIKTHELFREQQAILSQHVQNYEAYLNKKCKEHHIEPRQLNAANLAKDQIHKWSDCTLIFMQLFIEKNEQLFALLGPTQPNQSQHSQSLSDAYSKCIDEEKIDQLKNHLALIQLERISPSLPFAKLYLYSDPEADVKELEITEREWLDSTLDHQIWKKSPNISLIDLFHRALRAIVERNAGRQTKITALEKRFPPDVKGIFDQVDDEHLKWRNSLHPGQALLYITRSDNGEKVREKPVTLGKRIPQNEEGIPQKIERYHLYEIEGDPNRYLLIGVNCAALGMDLSLDLTIGSEGPRKCSIKDLDYRGNYARIEAVISPPQQGNASPFASPQKKSLIGRVIHAFSPARSETAGK